MLTVYMCMLQLQLHVVQQIDLDCPATPDTTIAHLCELKSTLSSNTLPGALPGWEQGGRPSAAQA